MAKWPAVVSHTCRLFTTQTSNTGAGPAAETRASKVNTEPGSHESDQGHKAPSQSVTIGPRRMSDVSKEASAKRAALCAEQKFHREQWLHICWVFPSSEGMPHTVHTHTHRWTERLQHTRGHSQNFSTLESSMHSGSHAAWTHAFIPPTSPPLPLHSLVTEFALCSCCCAGMSGSPVSGKGHE